ncbi:acyltransferase [Nitriliruptoraceae bacterium ZYF776]|nr:acyltransferase [Profundirhabdus halotolerans]
MSLGRRRVVGWDVLRGLAVLFVMARHAFPDRFPGAGVTGVVMFFSLSGYLITGLLDDELRRDGTLDLAGFYRRRAARLLPPLVAMLVVFAVVTLVVDPLDERHLLAPTVASVLTFTANLPLWETSPAAFHAWTLATEEQFYLLWPLLLLVGWRLRRSGAALAVAAVVTIVAAVATVAWASPHLELAYPLPTSWAVCFVVGAAAQRYGQRWTPPRWVVPASLTALVVMGLLPLRGHAWTYLVAGPAVAALTAVLMLAWRRWVRVGDHVVPQALAALGLVSYAAYLWNYPFTLWLRPTLGPYAGPVAAVATIVAAALTWRFVERPLQVRARRRRSRDEARSPTR